MLLNQSYFGIPFDQWILIPISVKESEKTPSLGIGVELKKNKIPWYP